MGKLHQLLAVDASQKGQAQKCRMDLMNTFEKKEHLFKEKTVTFTPATEGAAAVTESQSDIQTSVRQEVEWLNKLLVKSLDAGYAIDIANTRANADLVLDGVILAKAVPATALLQLQHRLQEIKAFITTIKTLDPASGFKPDTDKGVGIYKAREVRKNRTSKEVVPLLLAPATDKHAAQVDKITKDVTIGTILEQEWSSLITPALKAELLERAEDMYRAVVTARSKANDQEIDQNETKIGAALLDYIYQPLLA